ncbi:MAG: sporulation protein [Oscillospiraceae bacterium]|nr:sporulation protein [Oscillospiraceae bacterium]
MKKVKRLALDLSERLQLPQEALLTASKLTVTAGRRILIENHRGILAYGPEYIAVGTGEGSIGLRGTALRLLAMNRTELLIGGQIETVEWS